MLKVGVTGLGYWGSILYKSLSKNENYTITKICGRDNSEYDQNIFTYNDEDVIKSDVDLVIVSTQTKHHYKHIISALKNDKHVLVEKPICLTISESEEVIKLAKEKNKLLFVDHIYSTNPYVLKIKEILSDDKTELEKYKSSRLNEKCKLFDTSIIENLMYHDFYVADILIDNFDFYLKNITINHTPFEYCSLKIGPINFISSYRDKKTRLLEIKTGKNEIVWDELSGVIKNNGNEIYVDVKQDNINYKFDDIYNKIKNNSDDNSKDVSLEILKIINNL